MQKFLTTLLAIIAGLSLIKYREYIYRFSGKIPWAEKYLGQGGTITVITLLGSATVILSILYFTGALDILLSNTIGKLFKFQLQ